MTLSHREFCGGPNNIPQVPTVPSTSDFSSQLRLPESLTSDTLVDQYPAGLLQDDMLSYILNTESHIQKDHTRTLQ